MTGRVEIRDNPDEHRFEATLDGELAGFAEYQVAADLIVFTHTEVEPRFEGNGVGSALARHALDSVAADGTRRVLPLCPFIKAWIGRNPEYVHLVYGAPDDTQGTGSPAG